MSTTLRLRRFNDLGMHEVSERLLQIKAGETSEIQDLVNDDSLTEFPEPQIDLEIQQFASRSSGADYLTSKLDVLPWDSIENDSGLWTWIAVAWMDVLAPTSDSGRSLGALSRWILAPDEWSRYYRHVFAGPCYIFRAHRDDPSRAAAALCTPLMKPGEVAEQVASRLDIVRSPGLMGAVTKLYYDSDSGKIKAGAAGKAQPGTSRRLGPVLMQLERTWDIQNLSAERVLELLPAEFDGFQPETSDLVEVG